MPKEFRQRNTENADQAIRLTAARLFSGYPNRGSLFFAPLMQALGGGL